MCGRYTLATPAPADLRARFQISESVEIRRRYNVAPGDEVLAVTTDREGAQRGETLRWGLVPSWADGPDMGLKMINARVETAAEKPAFRAAMQRFRCLIIADGFYEWRRAPSGPKQAFWITREDGQPFAFAGLWSIWHPRTEVPGAAAGGKLRTCTILTTAANSAIASLHDRMPVILPRGAEDAWLDTAHPASSLGDLLAGLDPAQTALQAVGPAVNDARYDGPECLAAPRESGQGALF
ncbi:MAG: SOS response-associated peptidase [Actinomycetota bacterium]|nr:SOS response-associated peptidase [Actinomycetota bacterium]